MHCYIAVSVHSTLPHIHAQLTEESNSIRIPYRTLCCCLHFLFCKERRAHNTKNMSKTTLLQCKYHRASFFITIRKENPLDLVLNNNRKETSVSCVPGSGKQNMRSNSHPQVARTIQNMYIHLLLNKYYHLGTINVCKKLLFYFKMCCS